MGLLVALFNEKSDWSGKTVTYEDARHEFVLQDRGPVSAQALLSYDAQGQLDWADESVREWTRRAARTTRVTAPVTAEPPSPSGEADAAAPCRTGGAPGDEAARLSPAQGTPTGAEVLGPPLAVDSPSSSQPMVSPPLKKKVSHTAARAVKAESVEPGPMPASEEAMPGPAGSRPASAAHPALGEAGFICSLFGLGVPLLGVLGLILSLAARRQAERLGMAKGLSTAGIVLGIISTVVGLLLLLVALVG